MIRGELTPSSPIFISFHWQSSWSDAWMKYLRTQNLKVKIIYSILDSSSLYRTSHPSTGAPGPSSGQLGRCFQRIHSTTSTGQPGRVYLIVVAVFIVTGSSWGKKVSWCALKSLKMSPRPKEQPVQLTPLWPSQPSQGWPEIKMEWNSDLGLSDKLSLSTAPVQLCSPYWVVWDHLVHNDRCLGHFVSRSRLLYLQTSHGLWTSPWRRQKVAASGRTL